MIFFRSGRERMQAHRERLTVFHAHEDACECHGCQCGACAAALLSCWCRPHACTAHFGEPRSERVELLEAERIVAHLRLCQACFTYG